MGKLGSGQMVAYVLGKTAIPAFAFILGDGFGILKFKKNEGAWCGGL